MNTIGDRVRVARKNKGMTQGQLAAAVGIAQPTLSNLEKGKHAETVKIVEIAKTLGVRPEWLSSGAGPMLEGEACALDANVSPGPNIRGMLPLISWVQAGAFCDVIDCLQPGDAEAWYPCPVTHTPNAYVLRVDGDSMFPEYRDGEMIFVDPRGGYVHGDDVIVRDPDGKATFKRLQITPDGTFLLAINPAWPDRIIRIPDNSQICGKVIFQGRPR
ncbi:XRE family transcriptional regulator [Laribacter hongkongensis]|uniref:helix-turn-helix domain-containing protein n=1 Tax=Laribacter hongkongensis TaxID=168471 RepID=UPI001EFCC862|nr:helix-turn-helix transcriptional regulator [Laribacter hongkongensis]MCG9014564.1 XRE family transcriptional regulator [Laribacter hongkongensis]MCG9063304.1 XRE family transcriptional regulator [Laribacter hongkongensis]